MVAAINDGTWHCSTSLPIIMRKDQAGGHAISASSGIATRRTAPRLSLTAQRA